MQAGEKDRNPLLLTQLNEISLNQKLLRHVRINRKLAVGIRRVELALCVYVSAKYYRVVIQRFEQTKPYMNYILTHKCLSYNVMFEVPNHWSLLILVSIPGAAGRYSRQIE